MLLHDSSIEWHIIGCVLKRPELAESTAAQLSIDDFKDLKARLYFRVITDTAAYNKDPESFIDELLSRIKSQKLSGQITIDKIFELINENSITAGLNNFIEELKETNIRFKIGNLIGVLERNNKNRQIPVEESFEALINCLNSLDGQVRRPSTPANMVKEFIEESVGNFSLDDVCRQFRIFDRKNRQAISKVLSRRVEEGEIKRESNRNAIFRRIERGVDIVDWENAGGETIEFNCPLGSDRYAKLYKKSIVVIGGCKDAGKTAYALNSAIMNIKNFKQVRYVTSEMGPDELKGRLQAFNFPVEHWRAVEFIERHRDFADVVLPDGLTVIDFLDLTEEFYLVIKYMKEIYDELNSGIAVVCLQKDPGKDFSRGGPGSEDKARLAIHLKQDYPGNEAKINVGKIHAQEGINPKGFVRRYKLVKGSKFLLEGGWISP